MRRVFLILSVVGLAGMAAPVAPATTSAPRLIMLDGPPLSVPVVLSDWSENLRIIQGPELDLRPEEFLGRPFYDVALFWGDGWEAFLCSGDALRALRPEQAN